MLKKLIKRVNKAYDGYTQARKALAKELCDIIRDSLGWKVDWGFGWDKDGIDAIALYLPENEERWYHAEKYEALSAILLREFGIYVFVRSGDEWLTEEEAENLRARLKAEMEEEEEK